MKIVTAAIPNGLKAPDVIAWAEASLASGGPGNASRKIAQGLKGRNEFTIIVPPLQGEWPLHSA